MLPVEQDVIDLIDSRVESFDLIEQMCNDITCKPTKYAKRCKIECEEICLCHFLGLAYPNTPDSTAQRIAR